MSQHSKEMQERSKEGKERKRSRKKGRAEDDKPAFILGDGKGHYTRNPLSHLAAELAEDNKMDEAANLVVGLRPWAQRSTIGFEVVADRFDHKEKTGRKAKASTFNPFTMSSGEVAEAVANRSAA